MRPLIPLLLLAACQQGPDAPGNAAGAASAPAVLSAVQQRILALPKGQQDGVLFRAIRDGKAACQGVEETYRQPDRDGNPHFVARCVDGPVYAIAIDRNGVAQVTKVSRDRR